MDSLLLNALQCKKTERAPVWLMRQAGRYMKEYRDLKERYSFLDLCKNPDLATKITLMPIKAFQPDGAILFADILLILETLGFTLRFGEDHGPLIETHGLLNDLTTLKVSSVQETLSYIPTTIRNLKKELSVPLLGFCGAPFTLATYILEGRSSEHFEKTKEWLYKSPDSFHKLLDLLTNQTIHYLKMQIEAGVDAVQIFDSWLGFFPYSHTRIFAFPYLKKIIEELKPTQIPILLFAKGSSALSDELSALNPNAISLDSTGNLLALSQKIPKKIAIQGNFDPDLLTAPLTSIRTEVKETILAMKSRPGYIVNLGHGIRPNASYDGVRCFIETAKETFYSNT